jgi:lipoate-protein ligase A
VNEKLILIDSGVSEAEVNMAMDAKFLLELEIPTLHFYDWIKPSATFGHFIDVGKHFDLEKVAAKGISLARRPTGGGIVFHIWDLAFSFLLPVGHRACSDNTLENYRFVNEIVLESVREYLYSHLPEVWNELSLTPEHAPERGPSCTHFCMARPTIYDVVYNGLKIAGAAQRRTKKGYLHQGTISLASPDLGLLSEILLSKEEITGAMEAYSFAPCKTPVELGRAKIDLQELLHKKFLAKL